MEYPNCETTKIICLLTRSKSVIRSLPTQHNEIAMPLLTVHVSSVVELQATNVGHLNSCPIAKKSKHTRNSWSKYLELGWKVRVHVRK